MKMNSTKAVVCCDKCQKSSDSSRYVTVLMVCFNKEGNCAQLSKSCQSPTNKLNTNNVNSSKNNEIDGTTRKQPEFLSASAVS